MAFHFGVFLYGGIPAECGLLFTAISFIGAVECDPHYQIKEQIAFFMNTKINMLLAERDAAIKERDRALFEKRVALDERDTAITQLDNALRERDNAIAALQFQESTVNGALGCGIQRGMKRLNHPQILVPIMINLHSRQGKDT